MIPENARTKSKVISISMPQELVYQLYDLSAARKIKLSRLVAGIVAEYLGIDPNTLRGPGNPIRRVPDLYDQIKEKMGEMAPSRRDIIGMFGGSNSG